MIQVTMKDGRPAWISPAHVISVRQEGDDAAGLVVIYFDGGTMFTVQGNAAEIASRISKGV